MNKSKLGKTVCVQLADKGATAEAQDALLFNITPSVSGKIIAEYNEKLIVAPNDTVAYEPEIKNNLGIPQDEKLNCLYEKTCGAVLYTEINKERHYLLIKNESGHIGFPKGHIELSETEEETALREVFEETGLSVVPDRNFRMQYQYVTKDNIVKKCVYFMAHYDYVPAKIQESEISESWLVPFKEAMLLLNFVQDKDILRNVQKRLG